MSGILDWLAALDSGFAFLLALPFAIAALALLSERRRVLRNEGMASRGSASARRREHGSHLTTTTGA